MVNDLKVLVAGGKGNIGSHLAKAFIEGRKLCNMGTDVTIFDNLSNGHEDVLKEQCEFIKGDLRNPVDVMHLFENKFDLIFHFAGFIEAEESMHLPSKYWRNNFMGSYNLARAMAQHNVNKIVFSSTAAVYGHVDKVPIDENEKTIPINVYGQTKLAVENTLFSEMNYGLDPIILRYFNVAGAHPDGTIGEYHKPETHLIPRVILEGMTKTPTFIFGNDYKIRPGNWINDGTCIRDYIHIMDLIESHILAAEAILKGNPGGRIYNLGSKNGYSVKQVVDRVKAVTGLPINAQYIERRPGDPPILVADSKLAEDYLGWQREYELDDMIRHAFKFYQSRKDIVEAYRLQKAEEMARRTP